MSIKIYQVDAFTDKAFSGNPAAVCVLDDNADEIWMRDIANEMNLSETAFLYAVKEGYNLRWFTPTVEVDLCGHATLASAHILWEQGFLDSDLDARFNTKSGMLIARNNGKIIELDFPSEPEHEAPIPEGLAKALDCQPVYIGKNRTDYLVQVEDEEIVRNLEPDFNLLKRISARGVMVTSISNDPQYDFISRFFGPASGINEDPVTGSAHCCLGPYWGNILGKSTMSAYQASKRGGVLQVTLNGDRVILGGRAVTVLRGELT